MTCNSTDPLPANPRSQDNGFSGSGHWAARVIYRLELKSLVSIRSPLCPTTTTEFSDLFILTW